MRQYRFGINADIYENRPEEEFLPCIKAAGFDEVFSLYPGAERVRELAGHFARHGLDYACIHAPWDGINHLWREGEAGEDIIARLIACTESCGELGVPMTVVHLSSGENAPPITDCGRRRLEWLVETAEKHRVILAFENQRKLANLAYVFEEYADSPYVGFCWDCGHEHCFTPGRAHMPLFGKKLVYTHIQDNFCLPDRQTPDAHLIPFDGNIDYRYVADMLDGVNFDGALTLEVAGDSPHYADLTLEQFCARAAAAVRRLADLRTDRG